MANIDSGALVAAGALLGGVVMTTAGTLWIASRSRISNRQDKLELQNRVDFQSFMEAQGEFQTRQLARIDILEKQVSDHTNTINQLLRDNVGLEKKVNVWEAKYIALEQMINHVGLRIEDLIKNGLSEAADVKHELSSILSELRTAIKRQNGD